MSLRSDYAERVYAGILGKIIGVYLGRPFEGWTYDRILRKLGEIDFYVHDRLPWNHPLVVTERLRCTALLFRRFIHVASVAGIIVFRLGRLAEDSLIARKSRRRLLL